jgi:Flp pilus assembly protein TadG
VKRLLSASKSLARRFIRAQHAVAAVEFALVLPVMLTLYLGSIEGSSLYTVDRRITTISSTIGDLVAQADGVISQDDIDDYFKAAEGILMPYSRDSLAQIVSVISVQNSGATEVVWSRASGGTARTAGASYPLPKTSQMNQIARGGYLVVAETSYAYTPVFGMVIEGPINLYRESFYLPRFGECIGVGSACP